MLKYAEERAEQFKKSFLRENKDSASDLKYRFFYNNKGEGCLEFTVTPKHGYTWNKPADLCYNHSDSKEKVSGGSF